MVYFSSSSKLFKTNSFLFIQLIKSFYGIFPCKDISHILNLYYKFSYKN